MLINIGSLLISIIFSISFIELYIPISRNSLSNYIFVLMYVIIMIFFISKNIINNISKCINKNIFFILLILLAVFTVLITGKNFNENKKITVEIEALNDKNTDSLGNEVWISDFIVDSNKINFKEMSIDNNWEFKEGLLLSNSKKPAKIKWTGFSKKDVKIYLVSHKWSGIVNIKINDKEFIKDLYNENGKVEEVTVDVSSSNNISSFIYKFIVIYSLIFIIFGMFTMYNNKFSNINLSVITVEETVILKGIAVILVIISHLRLIQVIKLPIYLNYLGDWGVVIFLLLSGYGLASSYKYKGINKKFLIDRIKKVILPYTMITIIWILLDKVVYNKTYDFKNLILALIGMDFYRVVDPTMWYVTFILLWYVIFYLIFIMKIDNKYKIMILFIFSLVFRYYDNLQLLSKIYIQWRFHAYVFPLGVFFGLYNEYMHERIKSINKYVLNLLIYIIPLIIIIKFINNITNPEIYFLVNFSIAAIVILLVKYYYNFIKEINILKFIGYISYEIYLIHFALMTRISVFKLKYNVIFELILYTVILLVFSMVVKMLIKSINLKINKVFKRGMNNGI